jgi:hypothetical protein
VSDELERIWKQMIVLIEELSRNLAGGTEEYKGMPNSIHPVSPLKMKPNMSGIKF